MATPLKLWQYSEPKRLWPALGGLSVLAHVGILGLSLPYILDLMQASDSAETETIPIELIVVSPEEELPETIDNPNQNTSIPIKEQYSLPAPTAAANNNTFSQDAVDKSVSVPVQPLPKAREEVLQDSEPDDRRDDAISSDNSQSSSAETEDEEANNSDESESQADEVLENTDSGEVDEAPIVPTLPGEPTLPAPGEPAAEPEKNR